MPELVHFLGFDDQGPGPQRRPGKFAYEEFKDGKAAPTIPAPEEWYKPEFADDSWPVLAAPHSDIAMFQPRRPAVWRRHFTVSPEWKARQPRAWLYVFSLNRAKDERAPIFLNGQKVGEPVMGGTRNWTVAEVTSALKPGENLLALRLPQNFLGYRVYLTGQSPRPISVPRRIAQRAMGRLHPLAGVGRARNRCGGGLEAIREIDPDRSVMCMAPDAFIGGLQELCQDYGGHFHNTGYMAAWWAEQCPMMMRAANLPCSAEPGGPARTLPEFKSFLGHWLTEGVNAIHYFIHIGDVYWNDEIRQWFEEHQPMLAALGKMHVPESRSGDALR